MSKKSEKFTREIRWKVEHQAQDLAHVQARLMRLERTMSDLDLVQRSDKLARQMRHTVRAAERNEAAYRRNMVLALVLAALTGLVAVAGFTSNATAEAVENPVENVEAAETEENFENEKIEVALLERAHVLENCTVTHYDTCVQCCGKSDGITASGLQAVPGVTVAVDPSVIPLGSDVLVDYGDGVLHYYRADDTGSGVKGNAIDLCVSTHAEALELGRRTATVYWVEG